jgi:hypothetical protein
MYCNVMLCYVMLSVYVCVHLFPCKYCTPAQPFFMGEASLAAMECGQSEAHGWGQVVWGEGTKNSKAK